MQSLTATEVLVPQLANELRQDSSRLFASNDESKVEGSESGLVALLSAWTAIFQQQILPQAEDAKDGEISIDLVDPAEGGTLKTTGSKQQPDLNSTNELLGSIAGRTAIFWQQGLSQNIGAVAKSDAQIELPEVRVAAVSGDQKSEQGFEQALLLDGDKIQTGQVLPNTGPALPVLEDKAIGLKHNVLIEVVGEIPSGPVDGKLDTPMVEGESANEPKVAEAVFRKLVRFDTELNLKSEGVSRFKAALDRAAIPVHLSAQQEVVRPEAQPQRMLEPKASPEIPESSGPVEKEKTQHPEPEQELQSAKISTEPLPAEHLQAPVILSQIATELPKRESPLAPVVVPKSVPIRMPEVQTPLPLVSGEAKTISIRIPLTDASLAGTGEARHIDLVFNSRNSNLTLQFHSPTAEIQQKIEESMPSLLDKLQTANWTSKLPEAGAVPGAAEATIEARKRPEAVLPAGLSPEPARDFSMASTASEQGSSLDDPSANRREQNSQNPAGRNRKKVQAWQSELDEQLEP